MRIALIFRKRILEPTETFIVEQAYSLRCYKPILVGLRRSEVALSHKLPEILLNGGCSTLDKIAVRAFRYVPIAPGFFRKLRADNPSILHAHFATDGVLALPIARAIDVPLIVSLHGCDVTQTDVHFRKSSEGRNYLSHRRQLFERASAFICVSESIKKAALRAGFPEGKLRVHYTGINLRQFCPLEIERDPKLVLFVGRLVEKKGCEYALRAMAFVQQRDPQAHLEIIGDGPLRADLEALAKKLSLVVRFRGSQDADEVQRSMARARVLCNPSVTASSGDMEGFGMVFAEAQSMGTPVVSSMHSAIPEAVRHGETGLLCPERTPGSLAEALLRFLEDDVFWERASERSMNWVREKFDIAKQAVKLEELYDECLYK